MLLLLDVVVKLTGSGNSFATCGLWLTGSGNYFATYGLRPAGSGNHFATFDFFYYFCTISLDVCYMSV